MAELPIAMPYRASVRARGQDAHDEDGADERRLQYLPFRRAEGCAGAYPGSVIGTRALRIVTLLSLVLLAGCKTVRPWERGALAHPSMTADSPQGPAEEHMRSVHEGATGGQWRRGRWRVRLQLGRARLAAVATVLFVAAPDVRADDEPAETEAAPVEAVPVAPAGKVPSPYVVQGVVRDSRGTRTRLPPRCSRRASGGGSRTPTSAGARRAATSSTW